MSYLREDPNRLDQLLVEAANFYKMPLEFVEKDYWALETLRAVTIACANFSGEGKCVPIFKGGTSLSRAFDLLERFSEDIDVLINFTENQSNTRMDKELKRITEEARVYMGYPHSESISGRGHRNTPFAYTKGTPISVSSTVLLEMGIRGGPHPTLQKELRSIVANYAVAVKGEPSNLYEEYQNMTIEVLSPERTLLEKFSVLHVAESNYKTDKESFVKHARHVYDLYKILSNSETLEIVKKFSYEEKLALSEEIYELSVRHKWPAFKRPTRGYYSLKSFRSYNRRLYKALESAYDENCARLVYGYKPTYKECLKVFKQNRFFL